MIGMRHTPMTYAFPSRKTFPRGPWLFSAFHLHRAMHILPLCPVASPSYSLRRRTHSIVRDLNMSRKTVIRGSRYESRRRRICDIHRSATRYCTRELSKSPEESTVSHLCNFDSTLVLMDKLDEAGLPLRYVFVLFREM